MATVNAKRAKEGQSFPFARIIVGGAHAYYRTRQFCFVNRTQQKNPADILAGLNGPYDGLRWRVVALVAGWRGGDGG